MKTVDMVALRKSGLTYREIAARAGVSVGVVYDRIANYYLAAPPRKSKTMRPCLCCGNVFASDGPGNRLCDRCSKKSVSPFAP